MVRNQKQVRVCSECSSHESSQWYHKGNLCNKCYKRQDYLKHRDKVIERSKIWKLEHHNEYLEYLGIYRLEHREQHIEYATIEHLEHREERLNQMKIWRLEHPDYRKTYYLETGR